MAIFFLLHSRGVQVGCDTTQWLRRWNKRTSTNLQHWLMLCVVCGDEKKDRTMNERYPLINEPSIMAFHFLVIYRPQATVSAA